METYTKKNIISWGIQQQSFVAGSQDLQGHMGGRA